MISITGLAREAFRHQLYRQGKRQLALNRLPRAAALLKKAADRGHPDAAFEMALLFEAGKGVIADLAEARRYARQAADIGHVDAMALLARLYLSSGRPDFSPTPATRRLYGAALAVESEPELARSFALMASEHGHAEGAALAGYMLASGIGGKPDVLAARAAYETGVASGSVRAHLGIGTLLAGGHLGESDHAAAFPYFKFAAAAGNRTARHYLALQYLKGLGTEKNEEKAIKLLTAAAAKGYRASTEELARYYLDPAHPDRDRAKGIRWLTALARVGERRACRELEQRYRHGVDVEQDVTQALLWLEKAALKGDVAAQFQMAVVTATGGGNSEPDLAQARMWFDMAAGNGHAIAMVNLGRFRMKGMGGPVDLNGAREILESALDAGELAASPVLGEYFAFHADPPDPQAARAVLAKGVEAGDAVCIDILRRLDRTDVADVA
ncbi:SEL1-like repeat protein [Allorhizobium undicola]|uniref:SEL1-like repeat protein n=1 Tax=Allorhizobium undicola TaxID=78527 RepID=UPI003D32D0C8